MIVNEIGRSICTICKHMNSCSLITNKVFIWSCSEFKINEVVERTVSTSDNNNLDLINNKREIEFI